MKKEEKIKKLILLQKEACTKSQEIIKKLNKAVSELNNYYEKLCTKYNEYYTTHYVYTKYSQVPNWIYVKATPEEIKKIMDMECKKRILITLRDNMDTKIDKLSKKLNKFGG